MHNKTYRQSQVVTDHGTVDGDKNESLLAIVNDKCPRERPQMESLAFLIDFRVAHLKKFYTLSEHCRVIKHTLLLVYISRWLLICNIGHKTYKHNFSHRSSAVSYSHANTVRRRGD